MNANSDYPSAEQQRLDRANDMYERDDVRQAEQGVDHGAIRRAGGLTGAVRQRLHCADATIAPYRAGDPAAPHKQHLTDALADLMHWADVWAVDFDDALRIAGCHYEEEK